MHGDKQSSASISQQFDRARFLNIIKYFLNWRCDMEQQVEYLKPQPSAVQKEAHQQRVQAASLSNNSNNNLDQINSSGQQNSNCAIGEEVLANLTVSDRQKLMNGAPFRMPKALRSDMTVIIIEILPEILVSDSHNFMEAIFTKESINDFRRNFTYLKFSALRDKAIQVTKWRLQIDFVDSNKAFNSYQNLTIKLVIEQFIPYKHEILNQRHLKQALPVFKDPNVQTLIKNHRHWFSQNLLKKQCLSFQDLIDEQTRLEQNVHRNASSKPQNVFTDEFSTQLELPSLKEVLQNNQACSTGIQSTGVNSVGKINGKQSKKKNQRSIAGGKGKRAQGKGFKDCSESKEESNQEDDEESIKDSAAQNHENLNFGGIIQKTQVFRFQARNFPDVRNSMGKMFDLRTDIDSDFTEYIEQLQLKKAFQSQNLRINEMERLIIQEKGEQFYAEKKATKLRLWREQVEDEQRRMQLKIQIEYYQIGSNQAHTQNGFGTGGTANTYETLFKKDKDNSTGQRIPGFRSSRRIIGYTLGRSAASVKRNLLRLLDSSKTGDEAADNSMKSKLGATASPQKGRPRFNSQENILQLRNVEDSQKTQLQNNENMPCSSIPKPVTRPYSRKREPLSQYVVNPNSVLDDTESEQDSQDSFQAQLQKEMQNQAANKGTASSADLMAPQTDNVLQNVTIHREMFQAYLSWFENNHVTLKSKFDKLINTDQPENSIHSQQSFSNTDPVKLGAKDKSNADNIDKQIIDEEIQHQNVYPDHDLETKMNVDNNLNQDSAEQNIIQDNYDRDSLAQMTNNFDQNGHQKDQEMSIQEAPQNEHHLQLQELVSLDSQKKAQAVPNSELQLNLQPPTTTRDFNNAPFHLADNTSNYTALPLASQNDPTESNLEDPTTSQPLTSTHQADPRCPFGTSVAGSNFNNRIEESSQEEGQDQESQRNLQDRVMEAASDEDGQEEKQVVSQAENGSQGVSRREETENVSENQEQEQQVDIKPIETVYRPPFVLPEQQEFIFQYKVPVPQPPKPIEQMNSDEKELFEIEMEEYEAARHHEKIKQRREFLKLKQKQQLKEQEYQQNNINLMFAAEEETREYLKILKLQEQREREILENKLRIEQERLRQAEEAQRLQEEEEEAQRLRMRQEEFNQQQDKSISEDEPMNDESMPLQTSQQFAANLAVEGTQEGENDELDWGEGESNPESQNQSQRSNQLAQETPSPRSIKNQELQQNSDQAQQNQEVAYEQEYDQNQNNDSNVSNQDDQADDGSEAQSQISSKKNEGLSFTDSEAKRQREKCQSYIKNMGDKFIDQIDDGIKKNIKNDLRLRDANNQLNEDRYFDEAKQMSMEKSSEHRAAYFSNKKNEGIESIGSVDINNAGGSQYFQKLEDDASQKAKSCEHIDSPKFKSITQDDAEESSLNDHGDHDKDREELSHLPQNSAQNYDQADDARESRSSQEENPQNNETLQDEEHQEYQHANEEEYPEQYQIEDDNQQDSYVDQQQEDENEHVDIIENDQQEHCGSESHSEIEQEPETPGENVDCNDQDLMDQQFGDEAIQQNNNQMEENYEQDDERWSYNENNQPPEYQDDQNYINEEEEEMEQEQQPEEPVSDNLKQPNVKLGKFKDITPRNGPQSHRVNIKNYFSVVDQQDEQPVIEEAEEEFSNEEQDNEYDNEGHGRHPNQKPNIHPRYQKNSVAQGYDSHVKNHISNKFRESIQQIDLNYTRQNVPEKAKAVSQSIQNNNYLQKNSQQNRGMIMTNGMHKRGTELNSQNHALSARSPKKEQLQVSSKKPEIAEMTSPNQKISQEENDRILQLQAQVEALQKQIGIIMDSKQVEKQGSSPSRKIQISSSEQKRRPTLDPEADKFGSPKSCSQFNIGQQSPKVLSTKKADRIRPQINENQSQEAIASTFGKATLNEQSVTPDLEEDFSEEGPRFGGNDEYDQEVNQENFEHEEEAQSIEQEEFVEQVDEGPDTFNEQVEHLDEESEEEDLPVFGSQMKKRLKNTKSDFDLDGSPGSSGSHRMSRSKSPENPHINRIATEKSQYNDSQSDIHAYHNQGSSYANQGYKRYYNQYKGSHSMMRHRSRSVDNEDDYEDEASNDKRQRRASESSNYRQGSRSGGRNNENESQSDKLTFKNLSEFASIEIMKSNKQNVQEELKKRELKQQTKSQQARQDYLARQSNNQSQGSATFRSQNVEKGQPQSGTLASRKDKQSKDPQRYAKMPNSVQQQAQRASQHPQVESRQMRSNEDKVAVTQMSHRSSNRQLPPQYQKEINQGNQYSSQLHHHHQHNPTQYTHSIQHNFHGSQTGMVQYIQNQYSNHREGNQVSGGQDIRNGQAMGQQKQVRGQMTPQQIKQLQQRQQIRDSYNTKINGGDQGYGHQNQTVSRERHQSPSKNHVQSSNYDQHHHSMNQNGIQNSEQKRPGFSGSQHPRSPGSIKKGNIQPVMRSAQYPENNQTISKISNSGMKQGYSHSPNGNIPHSMYSLPQNQERSHPQMSQSPRIAQAKQARPPQNYGPPNGQNSANNVIKGAGSLVGANKRLMGPRQQGYYGRDGDDYQGHRQYDNEASGSNTMKPASSPNHHHPQHHPKPQGTMDHHNHVQKQLFQNEDRQAAPNTSIHPQSISNSTQKKRPSLQKQTEMLGQPQRSRGGAHPSPGANYGAAQRQQNGAGQRQSSAAKAVVMQNGQRIYKGGQY